MNIHLFFFAFLPIFAGCSRGPTNEVLAKVDLIEYHFHDSSVPPPYHRSQTIQVRPGSLRQVIDSYGNVVSEQEFTLNKNQFAQVLQAFQKAKLCKQWGDQKICPGGTSKSVTLCVGEQKVFHAMAYYCGGERAGDLGGDINGFEAFLEKMIEQAVVLEIRAETGTLKD